MSPLEFPHENGVLFFLVEITRLKRDYFFSRAP
jgi:hypothetical protein